MVLVVLGEKTLFSGSKNICLGLLFGLISSLTLAFYTVLSKKYVLKFGSLVFNSISFMIGSLVLMFIGIICGFQISFQLSTNNLLALLYLGIFVSRIGYFLFFEGLQNIPTANGSMFFLKTFYHEHFSIFHPARKCLFLTNNWSYDSYFWFEFRTFVYQSISIW
ncbi:MAG: EamA family transporter [Candidatus Cloacimonadota bacterium]|nr:EamA family transporter [Candidatus Cloacimonadota bacterium]